VAKRNRFKSLRSVVRSKVLWLNCGAGLAVFILIFFGAFWGMKGCTKHGQSVTVPNMLGRTMDEVESALKDAHLRWTVDDTTYNAALKPLEVISQDPLPGAKAKENRTIYLTINAAEPPDALFPPLREGTSLRTALSLLRGEGFVVDDIRYIPWKHTSVKYAEIDGKKAQPRSIYPSGTKVTLFVGSGLSSQRVSIPKLTGKTLSEAEYFVQGLDLNVGFTMYHENVLTTRDTVDAIIYRQMPSPTEEASLRVGEVVDVWLMNRQAYLEGFRDTTLNDNTNDL